MNFYDGSHLFIEQIINYDNKIAILMSWYCIVQENILHLKAIDWIKHPLCRVTDLSSIDAQILLFRCPVTSVNNLLQVWYAHVFDDTSCVRNEEARGKLNIITSGCYYVMNMISKFRRHVTHDNWCILSLTENYSHNLYIMPILIWFIKNR